MSSFISSSGLTYLWSKIKAWVNEQGFLTQHQDISGKADKATTLAGYGITNAYTKTESDGKYYALYGGTNLNPSSTNAVDLDNLTTPGSYYCASDAASQYVSNKPSSVNGAFRVWVSCPNGADTYLRQRCQGYSSYNVYERFYNRTSWSGWNLVQAWLGNYLSITGGNITGDLDVDGTLNVDGATTLGSTLDVSSAINAGSHINLKNANWIQMKDANGTNRACMALTASNNLSIGYGLPGVGDINLYATQIRFRVGGTAASNQAMLITSDKKIGIGTTSPSQLLEVAGVVKCTSVDTSSDETIKNKVGDINIKVEDIATAPNVKFTWKEGEDTKSIHGGTYAQYWEKITPYYVHGEEGDKSMDYASLAVSCSIELAKEVVALKEENTQLKKELVEIKEMISKLNK